MAHCFILAGGFATRLWPITERRAKPLLPLAGKPLLSFIVEAVPKNMPIVVSTNASFADDMRLWSHTMHPRAIQIIVEDAHHEGKKLGALGAVAKWIEEEKINDDILLLAGDNYANIDLEKFVSFFHGNPLIAGYDIGNIQLAKQFGTVILGASDSILQPVLSFEEKPQEPKSHIVSTGISMIPKSVLPTLCSYARKYPDNIGGLFEELLKQSFSLDCFVFHGLWKDIGSFEAYLALHREIVGEATRKDGSSRINENVIFQGSNTIGPKCRIEASTLKDCMVFGSSTIQDCVLERCIIDEDCILEGIDLTDQMIRAGTVLKMPKK